MAAGTKKKSTTKRLRTPGRLILILNSIAIAALLLSYLASYINPAKFTFLALAGISYPVILLINILFVITWMGMGRLWFTLSLAAILLGYPHLRALFQFNHSSENTLSGEPNIKVVNYNVRLFDLYNWSKNSETRDKIFDFLKSTDADIYCFQEFFHNDDGYFPVLDTLKSLLKTDFSKTDYFLTVKKSNHFGIATFSRFPIINSGKISLEEKSQNYTLFTDLLIKKDTVRVYNVHLQSIHFSYEDYDFYEEIGKQKDQAELKKGWGKILKKLYRAFQKRGKQVDFLEEHIQSSPYPVIVCGDFNDTPSSYTYHTISKGLKDAFVEKGNGFGKTYRGIFPSFRIDYMFHSPQLKCLEYSRPAIDYSDHYPIVSRFTLQDANSNP